MEGVQSPTYVKESRERGRATCHYLRVFMFLVFWVRLMGFLMECDNVTNLTHFLICMRERTWKLTPTPPPPFSWQTVNRFLAQHLSHSICSTLALMPFSLWCCEGQLLSSIVWDEEMLKATNAQTVSVLKIKCIQGVSEFISITTSMETVWNKSDFNEILRKFKNFAHV